MFLIFFLAEKTAKHLGWKSKAKENGLEFLKSASNLAVDDPLFKLRPQSSIHRLSRYLKNLIETEHGNSEVNKFVESASTFILNTIPDHPSKIDACTFKLEEILSSDTLWKLWKAIYSQENESKDMRVLFHFILSKFQKKLWSFRNDFINKDADLEVPDLKLTAPEENTLRYVAGYIPHSIFKKLENQTESDSKSALVSVLHSWNKEQGGNHMNFLNYTREWTEKINRGGLFLVNDDFYIFIRRLENVARKILNRNLMITYAGEDLRKVILSKFENNELIISAWDSLTKDLSKSMSTYLRNAVFKKWIDIRANAFIRAWVNIIKLKKNTTSSIDSKGKPALRKQLSG